MFHLCFTSFKHLHFTDGHCISGNFSPDDDKLCETWRSEIHVQTFLISRRVYKGRFPVRTVTVGFITQKSREMITLLIEVFEQKNNILLCI